MRIDVIELGKVKPRGRAVDRLDGEDLCRFIEREDLLVAVAPAETEEVGVKRFGKVAHIPVGRRGEGAMAF